MSSNSRSENGKTVTTTKKRILRQDGIEAFHGGLALGKADLKMRMTLQAVDKEKAEALAGKWEQGLKGGLVHVQAAVEKDKAWGPVVDALKTVRISTKGDSIILEAHGPAEAVVQAIRGFFELVRPVPDARPAAEPPQAEAIPAKKG